MIITNSNRILFAAQSRKFFSTKAASTFFASDLTVHPVDIKKIKPARPGEFMFG